jgi:predicted DNA-binding transcriptional regulator AlpA
MLLAISNPQPTNTERWFDLPELCEYLPDKPKKATVYGGFTKVKFLLIKERAQKKLRFLQSEIDAWLKQGKKKTILKQP